eukprot:scaffold655482_cov42-Prasinocladus_malaysianus.AAC.1
MSVAWFAARCAGGPHGGVPGGFSPGGHRRARPPGNRRAAAGVHGHVQAPVCACRGQQGPPRPQGPAHRRHAAQAQQRDHRQLQVIMATFNPLRIAAMALPSNLTGTTAIR